MIVRPHGGAAGVEVFKNNERQAAAIVERASSPPSCTIFTSAPSWHGAAGVHSNYLVS